MDNGNVWETIVNKLLVSLFASPLKLHILGSHLDNCIYVNTFWMQPMFLFSFYHLALLGPAPFSWYHKTHGGIFWTSHSIVWASGQSDSSRRHLKENKWFEEMYVPAPTGYYEKNMLSCDKCLSPATIETDKDKHETVEVERGQTEVERWHNNNWNDKFECCWVFNDFYSAFESCSFFQARYSWFLTFPHQNHLRCNSVVSSRSFVIM